MDEHVNARHRVLRRRGRVHASVPAAAARAPRHYLSATRCAPPAPALMFVVPAPIPATPARRAATAPATLSPRRHQNALYHHHHHHHRCAPPRTARLCTATTTANTDSDPPPPHYTGIQHAGVLVSDLARARHFYLDVLRMHDDTHLRNAHLPFRGAFIRAGETQIHLMVGDEGGVPHPAFQSGRPEHGGRDYHVAVAVRALAPVQAALEANRVPFTTSRSGRRALFCRDPDGNALEFTEVAPLAESSGGNSDGGGGGSDDAQR